MKITITQLLGGLEALKSIAGEKFSPVTALKIARIAARLQPEAELADAQRKKLLEEFGTLDEKNGAYTFPSVAATKAWEAAWAEVCKSEIDVHVDPLPFQALEKIELSPATMMGLEPLLLIEEAATAKPEIVKKKKVG